MLSILLLKKGEKRERKKRAKYIQDLACLDFNSIANKRLQNRQTTVTNLWHEFFIKHDVGGLQIAVSKWGEKGIMQVTENAE